VPTSKGRKPSGHKQRDVHADEKHKAAERAKQERIQAKKDAAAKERARREREE